MMDEEDTVKIQDYVVIQRQAYMKLVKVKHSGVAMLGKDKVNLGVVVGKPLGTTYKMEPKKRSKREFFLTRCDSAVSLAEQLSDSLSGGADNRNIFDDGKSQLLTTEEIVGMRDSGMSGSEIVGQLIENSKTFKNKTEYSQVKYLKKKEKKYSEFITIRRPTMRLISEILYKQDPAKLLGLRMDTLSQITTAVGVVTQGTYILYENGCSGLVAASLLNCLDEGGTLIHAIPGNLPQKEAINCMNFSDAQLSRLLSVNIYSLLRKLLQGDDSERVTCGDDNSDVIRVNNQELVEEAKSELNHGSTEDGDESKKRKYVGEGEGPAKKPRWEVKTEKAADILKARPADGLIIVAKEDPSNILTSLLRFVGISRPFVVYSLIREPLLDLYMQLKSRKDVIGLRLTESWLRSYQVLPNRTHPNVLMSGGGGYLLTGILVDGTYLS